MSYGSVASILISIELQHEPLGRARFCARALAMQLVTTSGVSRVIGVKQ